MIYFITGGARSGKSTYSLNLAKKLGKQVLFIASASVTDLDMEERIRKHREERPSEWFLIEMYENFLSLESNELFVKADTVIFDCVTMMINNHMFKSGIDFDTEKAYKIDELELKIKTQIVDLVYVCKNNSKNLIIVTNEVGMGLVSEYRISNLFRDIQGRINQILASLSDEVNFMVSGIPLRIK